MELTFPNLTSARPQPEDGSDGDVSVGFELQRLRQALAEQTQTLSKQAQTLSEQTKLLASLQEDVQLLRQGHLQAKWMPPPLHPRSSITASALSRVTSS